MEVLTTPVMRGRRCAVSREGGAATGGQGVSTAENRCRVFSLPPPITCHTSNLHPQVYLKGCKNIHRTKKGGGESQQNSARNETSAPVASYLGKRSSLTPTLTGRRRVGSEGTPSLTPSERAAVPPQGFPRSPERAAATVDGEERAG